MEFERVKLAALAMRALLFDTAQLEAVPLLDGGTGIALWIPFADRPRADALRKWLHALCNRAAALHPDLMSTIYNTHHDGRVHLHVSSNAAGHYSAVPYSLRAQGLTVCTPIHWEELGSVAGADVFCLGGPKPSRPLVRSGETRWGVPVLAVTPGLEFHSSGLTHKYNECHGCRSVQLVPLFAGASF